MHSTRSFFRVFFAVLALASTSAATAFAADEGVTCPAFGSPLPLGRQIALRLEPMIELVLQDREAAIQEWSQAQATPLWIATGPPALAMLHAISTALQQRPSGRSGAARPPTLEESVPAVSLMVRDFGLPDVTVRSYLLSDQPVALTTDDRMRARRVAMDARRLAILRLVRASAVNLEQEAREVLPETPLRTANELKEALDQLRADAWEAYGAMFPEYAFASVRALDRNEAFQRTRDAIVAQDRGGAYEGVLSADHKRLLRTFAISAGLPVDAPENPYDLSFLIRHVQLAVNGAPPSRALASERPVAPSPDLRYEDFLIYAFGRGSVRPANHQRLRALNILRELEALNEAVPERGSNLQIWSAFYIRAGARLGMTDPINIMTPRR